MPMNSQLLDFSILRFSGEKTQTFLQGQLTCDMRLLSDHGKYSLAACCDHRGRMIANFWVVKWQDDFLFILPKNMIDITKNHLQKYAMFSKVLISEDNSISIIETKEPCETSLEKICIILPNGKRHIILTPTADTHTESDAFKKQNINDGLCILQPKTSLLFTPQMINLDKFGGVSFDKGCYVGQEIVARTEHLGTLKRHLHHLQIESDSPLNPGDPLIKNNNEIGTIADAIEIKKNHYEVLAVIEDRYT